LTHTRAVSGLASLASHSASSRRVENFAPPRMYGTAVSTGSPRIATLPRFSTAGFASLSAAGLSGNGYIPRGGRCSTACGLVAGE
jgi:hypothetical protein